MKLRVVAVGRPARFLEDATAEYEQRAARYWPLEVMEVKEERARKGLAAAAVREAEGERILQRIPAGCEVIALTRNGQPWSSTDLSRFLQQLAVQGSAGAVFVIGGATGLGENVLARATRALQLSSFTFTHEIARLVLAEQLYRAGTIARGEPYHKGAQ